MDPPFEPPSSSRSSSASSPPSFDEWYPEAWPRLVSALLSMVGTTAEAEDLASQAIAKTLEKWDTIDDPSAWTYRVAVNLARRRWRRLRREMAERSRWIDPPTSLPEVTPELWQAVGGLPQRQRIAVALRYVLDLSQEDIAQVMGIAPGTVAATLHSARQRLRTVLGAEDWT
jgi:RNA polymerase sigma-70 factor (ECF subfamily)